MRDLRDDLKWSNPTPIAKEWLERAIKAEEELARLGKRFPVTIDKKTQVIVDRKAFDACMGDNAALRDELIKTIERCAPDHSELAGYKEEVDLQRDSIQRLSAQVAAYQEILTKTLPTITELAETIGYGYYKPEDPRDFTPDYECCSKTEISNWKNDCVKADAGKEIGDMRAWGMGTYKIKNPGMIELRDKIKTILTQPDPGAEIRERLTDLESQLSEANKLNRELLEYICPTEGCDCDGCDCDGCEEARELTVKCGAEIRERIAKLEAVAVAAKELISACFPNEEGVIACEIYYCNQGACAECAANPLKQTLAALGDRP